MRRDSRTEAPRWQAYRNPDDPNDPEPWGPAETLPAAPPAPLVETDQRSPHGRRLAAVLAGGAVLFGAAWAGAGWLRADVTTPITEAVQAVAVDVDTAPIAVRFGDVPQVQVVEHNRPRGSRLEHRVVDGHLEISHNRGFRFGPGITELEIVLPHTMRADTPDVTVETTTGSVELEGDYGTVTVSTTTGQIEIDGNSESVRAEASTGHVEVAGAPGDLVATANTGSLDLDLRDVRTVRTQTTTGSQDITVTGSQPQLVESRGTTGSIRIQLPDGTYQVQSRSNTGSTEVTVANDPTSPHRVIAETSTGSIRIN